MKIIQGELFNIVNYTFLCSICRGEFPRSIEFFPTGRCGDKLSSFCRKCSSLNKKRDINFKEIENNSEHFCLPNKTCEECGETKEIRKFYMSSHTIDGKTEACKKCIDEIYVERKVRQESFRNFSWVVYFIQDSRNKRVKIGLSDDPEKTFFELQEGSSEKLYLLATHDSGEKKDAEEAVKILHSLFRNHSKFNDWFEMVPSLEQYISLLKSTNNQGAKILISTKANKKIKRL